MALEILTLESMPFAQNSYLLWRDDHRQAIVVDPGLEPYLILETLEDRGLVLGAVLNTHGHADHIAGNAEMKRAFPEAPLIIGRNDAPLLRDPEANMSRHFGFEIVSPEADQLVQEGDRLSFAGIDLEVLDLPGHSPGHVVFLIRETPLIILGGDVLFRGSVGRTDFPGGSFELLRDGIRSKLFPLPGGSVVYPGHGPVTTIAHEKKTNPFVGDEAIA